MTLRSSYAVSSPDFSCLKYTMSMYNVNIKFTITYIILIGLGTCKCAIFPFDTSQKYQLFCNVNVDLICNILLDAINCIPF